MIGRPTGTVTFLFTDIEGSTKLWEEHPEAMKVALARHDTLLRIAIESHAGYVFKTVGDAFCAAFSTASDALASALAAQRSLQAEPWAEVGQVLVRMALHTGVVQERDGDYFGPTLNRVARLLSAGHGGQVLLSMATDELVRDTLPDGASLCDLGQHRLKDLQRPEHIFQLIVPDLLANFPALRTLDNHFSNLPVQSTAFVGREKEVEMVRQRLLCPDVRVLTLTGPGGIGKTRLGIQVAAGLHTDFADGTVFVPLVTIRDPDLIVPAIARAFGIREDGAIPLFDRLRDNLRDKYLLLVLDNFEQVLNGAQVVAELAASCPKVKVLVTSRAPLNVYGEQEFEVPPLELADSKELPSVELISRYEAVCLFSERARNVRPDFAVTHENARAVLEICQRLDGLPLAIELAAARTKILSPQAMLPRLESRLKILTGGARDLPARQRAMRDTIAWSYDLLSPADQTLFRRLAVFAGGCTPDDAGAVCNSSRDLEIDVFDGLVSLIDQSMLRQEESSGGEPRFHMLETIREFAREQLATSGETSTIERQHAYFYLELAEGLESSLMTGKRGETLEQLNYERDNLLAALAWSKTAAASDGGEVELRLSAALRWFWYHRGNLSEGRNWLTDALARPAARARSAGRAKALHGAGLLAFYQADHAPAYGLLGESAAIWREVGDKRGLAYSLVHLGLTTAVGDMAAGRLLEEESAALFREIADLSGLAESLLYLGALHAVTGDISIARTRLEESRDLFSAVGDQWGVGGTLIYLGIIAKRQGDTWTARNLLAESVAICREVDDKWRTQLALCRLGDLEREQGNSAGARAIFHEGLSLSREVGSKDGVIACLQGLAMIAVDEGNSNRGARLFGAADILRETVGSHLPPFQMFGYDRYVVELQSSLGEVTLAAAWTKGRAMKVEEAINYALEE